MQQEQGNYHIEEFLPTAAFQGVADFLEVTAEDFPVEAQAEDRLAELTLLAHLRIPMTLAVNGEARDGETVAVNREHRGPGTGKACTS